MKKTLQIWLVSVVLLVLTGGWVYLYTNSHAVTAEKQNEALAILKDMKQMDANWNVDVLRSQTELNLDYDPLASPLSDFSAKLATLDAEAKSLNDSSMEKVINDIRTSINEKAGLIDQFKAQNALLKNSLRYVPTAHREIREQMHSMQEKGKSDTAHREISALVNLESNVSALVSDTLRYNTVPDVETAELLKAGIKKMREDLSLYPDKVRDQIDLLMKHLELVLNFRNQQFSLLQGINNVPVVSKLDRLGDLLNEKFDAELTTQFIYQRILLTYSACVLLLVFGAAALIAYRNATERKRLTVLIDKKTLELKENEAQLMHAQKMNTLGEMVAGITHEVNTPLAAIKSGLQTCYELVDTTNTYINESNAFSSMLVVPPPADEEARKLRKTRLGHKLMQVVDMHNELVSMEIVGGINQLLSDSLKNIDYISQIVTSMLNFSRLDRSKISKIKIEECINTTLIIGKHFLKTVKVNKKFGETTLINCDIAQINQVLLNLIKNGAQAMPVDTGEITIETSMLSAEEICISISDNGAGIPAEIQEKIWEPFFTTKKAGSGTGLGLSTCKKIITSHGGRIDMKSEVGKGTTFSIVLPLNPSGDLYATHGEARNNGFVTAPA